MRIDPRKPKVTGAALVRRVREGIRRVSEDTGASPREVLWAISERLQPERKSELQRRLKETSE